MVSQILSYIGKVSRKVSLVLLEELGLTYWSGYSGWRLPKDIPKCESLVIKVRDWVLFGLYLLKLGVKVSLLIYTIGLLWFANMLRIYDSTSSGSAALGWYFSFVVWLLFIATMLPGFVFMYEVKSLSGKKLVWSSFTLLLYATAFTGVFYLFIWGVFILLELLVWSCVKSFFLSFLVTWSEHDVGVLMFFLIVVWVWASLIIIMGVLGFIWKMIKEGVYTNEELRGLFLRYKTRVAE